MSRVLAALVRGWRLLAIAALVAALAGAAATSALAGPVIPIPPIPITPVFPPWWTGGWFTASQPATITGVVRNATGEGIPGVTVRVSGETSSSSDQAHYFQQSAETTNDGSFVITDVIQGTYQMSVNDPDTSPTVLTYREEYPWYDASESGGANTKHWVQGGTTVDAGSIVLKNACTVSGHAMRGGTPVSGSRVSADVTEDGITYMRWTTTAADGSYAMTSAPSGDWSLTFSGSGSAVPVGATRSGSYYDDPHVVTESTAATFTLAPGGTRTQDQSFVLGHEVYCNSSEYYSPAGTSFQISGISVTATSTGGEGNVFRWTTDDVGLADVYLPPGTYNIGYHDDLALYQDLDIVDPITATSGGSSNVSRQLTPAGGTFAMWGELTESGTSTHVESWISAEAIDPGSSWTTYLRRVPSNGTGDGHYMIRLPVDTGFSGNGIRIDITDQTPGYSSFNPVSSRHPRVTYNVTGPSDIHYNVSPQVGGVITGTVHDELGNPVRGVIVSVSKLGFSPLFGGDAWTGDDNWWTFTDASGQYALGGLPTNSDYKVAFLPDYNPGYALPIHYADYYQRIWRGRAAAWSLNTSATPVAVDHDPVAVSLGTTTTGVDETITPGGRVVVHADGPEYPTGAVYCDVMYRVGSAWVEVDSGFTTGGTFHKDWKVLPTGQYRVDYSDYFGRGSGSCLFDLTANEHHYSSIVVPTPLTPIGSWSTPLPSGAFAGLIDGGLKNGGTGGGVLEVQRLSSMPATTPAPASNLIPAGGIFDFSSSGATFDGTWSLKLPYNTNVPDNLVSNLRVRHALGDGSVETLVPFTWNTAQHTLQIQSSSLSPFQVMFARSKVAVSRPTVPAKIKRRRAFAVTGTLSPQHLAGAKSVQLEVYKYTKRKWRRYSRVWAKNSDYRGVTMYRGSLKLGKGSYRIYAVAPADTWHYATTSAYRQIKIK